jgi:hypothetical protein
MQRLRSAAAADGTHGPGRLAVIPIRRKSKRKDRSFGRSKDGIDSRE